MKFELSNFKHFKDAMIAAEAILDEIKFEADNDGLRFRGLDRSHIAFMSMNISKDYFDVFDIKTPESCIIDTSELVKVLKRSKTDDIFKFQFDEENVTIQFEGNARRTFKIRNIDGEYDSPMMPNIEYPCNVEVNYKQLQEAIKDCDLYDDKLRIKTLEYQIGLSAVGDLGEYEAKIDADGKVNPNLSSVFAISWLKTFFKIGNISESVEINMGKDMPMLLRFIDEYGLTIEFLIAPRIEEDY